MIVATRKLGVLLLALSLPGCAQPAEHRPTGDPNRPIEVARRANDAMWGYQCAALAVMMENNGFADSAFDTAHTAAREFIAGVNDGTVGTHEIQSEVPAIVVTMLHGRSNDAETFAKQLNAWGIDVVKQEVVGDARMLAQPRTDDTAIREKVPLAAADRYKSAVCRRFERYPG